MALFKALLLFRKQIIAAAPEADNVEYSKPRVRGAQ